jgi:hypothetical protein
MTGIDRRRLLLGGCVLGLAAGAGLAGLARSGRQLLLSAADQDGQHWLLGLEPGGRPRFRLPVPYRAHDSAWLDHGLAAFFARRPGRETYLVDTDRGHLLSTLRSPPGLHFCGHGVLSADNSLLYMTEYAYERRMGVVGIYETRPPFARLGQMDTGGLDPHQLALLPDGRTLVVANGGILTHPDSDREMLNLDTMDPSLVYLELETGRLLDQWKPPHHQTSLRHLAVCPDGSVVVGAQDHAPDLQHDPNPLVFRHQPGGAAQAFSDNAWQRQHQYIASVALDSSGTLALTTTPIGGLISLWQVQTGGSLGHFPVKDVAGAIWTEQERGFLVSNGLGQLLCLHTAPQPRLVQMRFDPGLQWDNHMRLAPA